MDASPGPRLCRCGTRLARDHSGQLCHPCQRRLADLHAGPPPLPPGFWNAQPFHDARAAQHIGHLFRAYRKHPAHAAVYGPGGIPQERLGYWLELSQPQVSRIESGPPVHNLDQLNRWARILAIPEHVLWFAPLQRRAGDEFTALSMNRHAARPGSPSVEDQDTEPGSVAAFADFAVTLLGGARQSEANDMHRRTLIFGAGAAALGLEAARHGLTLATAEDRADVAVEEWQEIVNEYGYSYQVSAPAELFDSLAVDVLGVQYAIDRAAPDDRTARELCRVAAFLAAFVAQTVANLGGVGQARRWWRSARRAADESGDHEASLWIRGREVVRAPYEGVPLATVLNLVDEAESRVRPATAPSALPQLYAGKAQALAVAGRHAEAIDALEKLAEAFAGLPSTTSSDHDSLFGYGEERMRFAEGFVFSHVGDIERADEAQHRALSLYPESYPRGPAQIELQRAFCLVRNGDAANGSRHVLDTMSRLPREQHVRPVVDLGKKALEAVPMIEQHLPSVQELRDYLTGHDG